MFSTEISTCNFAPASNFPDRIIRNSKTHPSPHLCIYARVRISPAFANFSAVALLHFQVFVFFGVSSSPFANIAMRAGWKKNWKKETDPSSLSSYSIQCVVKQDFAKKKFQFCKQRVRSFYFALF